ncbi:C-type natriuretic peptide 1-like [Falco cherrug]|uniref:C-type natriuretic peptide 1-like n=1 Tax=Falco cherrug TaxID=345164 RepID=UPI00247A550F|nr:C-type natriuretic peptide 1-like [Falco cherrug]
MKINLKLLFCPGFLLLLMVSQSQARAKPISSLQRMSGLLDEDLEHPLVSEDRDHEQDNIIPRGAFDQQDTESQWTRNTRDQPEGMSMGDSAVQRFFSDLQNSPRKYQGLSRGCFGVKLDRIGSLSGLGC